MQQRVTCSRSGKHHRRVMRDAAIERAVLHDRPTTIAFFHFNNHNTLKVLQFQNVISVLGRTVFILRQVDPAVGILMVDRQQLLALILEALHAVGVFAKHFVCTRCRATGLMIELFSTIYQSIAPAGQDLPVISFWNMNSRVCKCRDWLKSKARNRRLRLRGGKTKHTCAHHRCAGAKCQHTTQKPAARNCALNNAVKFILFSTREVQLIPLICCDSFVKSLAIRNIP